MISCQTTTNMANQEQTNANLQGQIDQLRQELDLLRTQKSEKNITNDALVKSFDVLMVDTLIAGLPVYTVARTGIPKQGQPYVTNIAGTRKICVYISGTEYCATLT